MRSAVVLALIACVGLLLQSTVLHGLSFGWIVPDVLLVLGVYLGLNQHSVSGSFGAFALGYLQDAASASPAGLNASGMLVVFVLVYLTCRRLWVDNVVSKVVLVFLASLIKATVVVVLMASFVSLRVGWSSIPGSLLTEAVLTAAVAPAVFWLLATTGVRSHRESD
jgi:rod shape-determining protein MreD